MKTSPSLRSLVIYAFAAAGGFGLHHGLVADRPSAALPPSNTPAPAITAPPQTAPPASAPLPDFHFATLTELHAIGTALHHARDAATIDVLASRRGFPKSISLLLAGRLMQMPAIVRSRALRQAATAGHRDITEACAASCDLADTPELLAALTGTEEERVAVRILFERRTDSAAATLEKALADCPRRVKTAAYEGVLRSFLTSRDTAALIAFLRARSRNEWPRLHTVSLPVDIPCDPRMAAELYGSGVRLPSILRGQFRGLSASMEPLKCIEQLRQEKGIDPGGISMLGAGLEKIKDPAQISAALEALAADHTRKGKTMHRQLYGHLITAALVASHPDIDTLLSFSPEDWREGTSALAARHLAGGPADAALRFFTRSTPEAAAVKEAFLKEVPVTNPKLARQIAPSLGPEDRAALAAQFHAFNGEDL